MNIAAVLMALMCTMPLRWYGAVCQTAGGVPMTCGPFLLFENQSPSGDPKSLQEEGTSMKRASKGPKFWPTMDVSKHSASCGN